MLKFNLFLIPEEKEMFIDYEQSTEFAMGYGDMTKKEYDKISHLSQKSI